jgi:polyhydroxybutyrate depolymerase
MGRFAGVSGRGAVNAFMIQPLTVLNRASLGLAVATMVACGDDGTGGSGLVGSGAAAGSDGGGATNDGGAGATTSTGGAGGAGGGVGGSGGALPLLCEGFEPLVGEQSFTIDWDGDRRSFLVRIPMGYDVSAPLPVVFVFHGYTQTAEQIEAISKMTPAADARGYLVVYAQGLGTSWNAGGCCGTSSTFDVDDVGFVGAMLTDLSTKLCVDPKRVHACGFSNGGMLSHRLACEAADVFASVGAVSGTIALSECAPSRPIAVMHQHGTSDFIVPYDGFFVGADTVPETIDGWVARNGCTTETLTFEEGDVTCVTHGGCTAGADVTLCTLEGGGHQWPGGESAGPAGEVNMDLAGSEALLDFFDAHPMP